MKKKSNHIKRDVGLAALFGAFALAFFATYPSVAELNKQTVATLSSQIALETQDFNNNGIADSVEVGYYSQSALHGAAK
jgi:hypothetical protein